MATPQSAVTKVKPKAKRGRNPAVLPGGKPLAEARTLAKSAVSDAKSAHRTARDAHQTSVKTMTGAKRNLDRSQKALDSTQAKWDAGKFKVKSEGRTALSTIKATHREHTKAHTAAVRDEKRNLGVFNKAADKLTKAENAKLAVEAKRLATK